MNLETWLITNNVSWEFIAANVGLAPQTLKNYSRQRYRPSDDFINIVHRLTKGEVTEADFKPNHANNHVTSGKGNLIRMGNQVYHRQLSQDLLEEQNPTLAVKQLLGPRLRENKNGYLLDGVPIATVQLYRYFMKEMEKLGSPITITYPGL